MSKNEIIELRLQIIQTLLNITHGNTTTKYLLERAEAIFNWVTSQNKIGDN